VLAFTATCDAPPETVWKLIAEPAQWHRWAPHVRGAKGLGDPEVQRGLRGTVRLAPAVPLPVSIVAKRAGRYWDWRVGPVEIRHAVSPRGDGSEVRVEVRGPTPLEITIGATYGPLIRLLVANLARVAARP
jgi:carbon monoxide dehydrogenase subunit G